MAVQFGGGGLVDEQQRARAVGQDGGRAAAILVSLPVIVLSFVFQRQFIRGILSGAVKG